MVLMWCGVRSCLALDLLLLLHEGGRGSGAADAGRAVEVLQGDDAGSETLLLRRSGVVGGEGNRGAEGVAGAHELLHLLDEGVAVGRAEAGDLLTAGAVAVTGAIRVLVGLDAELRDQVGVDAAGGGGRGLGSRSGDDSGGKRGNDERELHLEERRRDS
jgi:hypothetical protein